MDNTFYYTAGTPSREGETFKHNGSLRAAIEKAVDYGMETFARDNNGNGPIVVVVDAYSGRRVYEERL